MRPSQPSSAHSDGERQHGERRDDHGAGRGAAVNLADGAGRHDGQRADREPQRVQHDNLSWRG